MYLVFKRRNLFDGDPLLGNGVHGGNDDPVGALPQELERVVPRPNLKKIQIYRVSHRF
jgi:hypothetical protein